MDFNISDNTHWSVLYKKQEIGFARSQAEALIMAIDFLKVNNIKPGQMELTVTRHVWNRTCM